MFRIVVSTALLLLLSIPEHGSAMRVKLLTLEQMVERAEMVFVGRCLTSTAQDDPQFGQTVTVIEFEVVEALKGQLGDTHTLRQYGGTGESTPRRTAPSRKDGLAAAAVGGRGYVLVIRVTITDLILIHFSLGSPSGVAFGIQAKLRR